MKKNFLFLLLAIGLTSNSSADYLDDWPDEALCGWMDNPSPPSYMVEEVKKRGISCAWGVVINNLPDLDSDLESVGESRPPPEGYEPGGELKSWHFNKEAWLSNYGLKPEDLSPMLLELSQTNQASVPECTDDFCFTMQPEYRETTKEFTPETWLSEFELKPEDLSPMLLELAKETQAIVPECTTDFCFTMQEEYETGEIINKGALINALYRHHPDYKIEPEWSFKDSSYCSEKKGCYRIEKDYAREVKTDKLNQEILNKGALINALYRHNPDIIATLNKEPNKNRTSNEYCQEVPSVGGMEYVCSQVKKKMTYDENGKSIWLIDKLFPEEAADPDCKPLMNEKDIPCKNRVYAYGGGPRPDDWLKANSLTDEDLVNLVEDYPTTYIFEGDKMIEIPLVVETEVRREFILANRHYITELFPMNDINPNWFINCKNLNPEDNCLNGETPHFKLSEGTERLSWQLDNLFTPEVWLEENGLTAEDVISMLKDYPTTYEIDRETMDDECKRNSSNPIAFEEAGCIADGGGLGTITLNPKHTYTDEIINTDQLLQSLLFLDPNALDPNLIHKWEGPDKIVEYAFTDEITNTDQLIKSLLFLDPYLFGSDVVGHRWNYERRPDDECTRNVYDPKDYEEAGCIKDIIVVNFPKECMEDNPPFYCMLDGGEMPPLPVPPIVQPPLEPTPPVPIRPGWKIAEGSNFWSIDAADPYWQTDEGSAKLEASKARATWIEEESSRYAQENPGVDPPIPSYYATDPCGEGKQPENASC